MTKTEREERRLAWRQYACAALAGMATSKIKERAEHAAEIADAMLALELTHVGWSNEDED
jgi:hypothetical protein